MKKHQLIQRLTLQGLRTAPAQVHAGVRLVPLLRQHVRDDIRLGLRRHQAPVGVVALDGTVDELQRGKGTAYVSVIPHSMVVRFGEHGAPVAALGAQLLKSDEDTRHVLGFPITAMHRMVKGVDDNTVRFAPLHLAVERLLSVAFAGPEVDWPEISKSGFRHGMVSRSERAISGRAIAGLDEAIRTFELHDEQVGVAVFVDDVLASVAVVPHPDDWRAVHRSLLEDFWCELFVYGGHVPSMATRVRLDEQRVTDMATLRAELARARVDDGLHHQALLTDVIERDVDSARVRTMGPFTLQRFHTDLAPGKAHHVGEAIVRDDGEVEYLKTFRLSDGQSQRAYVLQTLAKHQFRLIESAAALRCGPAQMVERVTRAGFAFLFRAEVLKRFAESGVVAR